MVSKPKGWQWITLENVLQTLETGKRPKGGVLHQDSGVLSISAEHMTPSGGIDTSVKRFVPVDFYRAMKKGKVQLGDVLVVKDGATTGKTAYADSNLAGEPIVVNEHVFICRPNRDVVNPRFLFYWLWSEEGWAQIRTCYQGSTIGGINRSFIQKVTVPLPPLTEQQRIAGILNQQMAYVEKARQAAEEILDAAQALPGAFLRQAFPAHGDALPAGWKWVKVGDVCQIIRGVVFKKTQAKSIPAARHLPVLRAGNITDKLRTDDDLVWIPEELVSPAQKLKLGDIAMCISSGSASVVGKTAMLRSDWNGTIGGFCAIIRAESEQTGQFLGYWFRSHQFLAWRDSQARGSNIQNLRTRELSKYKIPLPPLTEQKRIAALLNQQMAYVETVRMSAREQLDAINALPAALLRRAFAGGL